MRIGMDTRRRNWCYTHLLPRVITRDGVRVLCYTLESNRELVRMLGLEPDHARGLETGFPAARAEERRPSLSHTNYIFLPLYRQKLQISPHARGSLPEQVS
jgi:hypothetical protein